jgi:hypothetical protein
MSPSQFVAIAVGLSIVLPACSPSAPPVASPPSPAPASTNAVSIQRGDSVLLMRVVGDAFTPKTGEAALRAFVPDVAPVDSGGECAVARTTGSGATTVTAGFPARIASQTSATMTFDSAGHLVRFSERRGRATSRSTTGMTTAQRDSTLRAMTDAVRITMISLDYSIDQAIVTNRGGGKPSDGIFGTVRAVESLPQLGPLTARLARVRQLCGV